MKPVSLVCAALIMSALLVGCATVQVPKPTFPTGYQNIDATPNTAEAYTSFQNDRPVGTKVAILGTVSGIDVTDEGTYVHTLTLVQNLGGAQFDSGDMIWFLPAENGQFNCKKNESIWLFGKYNGWRESPNFTLDFYSGSASNY